MATRAFPFGRGARLYYWRDGTEEVDYVVTRGDALTFAHAISLFRAAVTKKSANPRPAPSARCVKLQDAGTD
jgi:hypothetical protein